MLHGSETWPVRKENEVALQRAEMRMVRWMCNVKVKDRVPSKELRERLGIDDIILILHRESKKGATLTMAVTLSILDRFPKFFHCCKQQ